MKKNLEKIKGIYIAHRGLYNEEKKIPENSRYAFKEAIKKHIPIELDLHLLKDGNIVVFHDDNLKRMTGYDKQIKKCTYEEIKNLKLQNTEETIPLFKEILNLVNGQVLLDIELKTDLRAGILEKEAVKLLDKYSGDFIVKSFNPWTVRWFKKNKPEYIRGQLSYNFKDNKKLNIITRYLAKNMILNIITKPDFIAYDIKSFPNSKVEKSKKPILIWTIRNKDELEEAKKYGDSFIFEKIGM